MKNGRMVTSAEAATDFRQRARRHHLGEIHCDLTRLDDGAGTAVRQQVLLRDIVMTRDDALDFLNADALRLANAGQVAQQFIDAINGNVWLERLAEQKLVESAFQFAARSSDSAGNVGENLVTNAEAWIFRLCSSQTATEHFNAHFIVRCCHFKRDTALKARTDTHIKRFQFGRRTVGSNNNLFGAVEQRIQEMAEFVLNRLALQELHVIDHEKVDIAKLFLERERIIVADGGGEAPPEIFRRQIDD